MDINKILTLIFGAIFINNFIFSRFLGLCPFFGVSKKIDSAIGMGFAATFVLVMSTAVIFPVNYYILVPLHLDKFLQIIVFIFVIAAFVQLVELALKKLIPTLYHMLGIYLPLITTNCAILGTAFIVVGEKYTFLESIIFALSAGMGFTLALIMMAGVRERLIRAKVPKAFKDLPIAFISAALMSLAMFGFIGIVK
ncbi:MAG: RnfABCDGE type electron transport complex subunit A [Brevinematales bacterium]|nr:RnfABCDGE type electron transport complex subunit A [Brevinematales bacterium]